MATEYISTKEAERQNGFIKENRKLLGTGKLFHIITFGCQLNDNDSEKLPGLCEAMGMQVTGRPAAAGLVIIKTLQKDKPERLVVVCGCMMKQDVHVDKIRRSYPFVDILFGPADIYRFPELLNRRLQGSRRV